MQEWLPPHHVPQNVEAEPTQWFPNWVSGGTPRDHQRGTGKWGPPWLYPDHPACPCFIHGVPRGILCGRTSSAAKSFGFLKIFHLEIMSDFRNVNKSTFPWKYPHIVWGWVLSRLLCRLCYLCAHFIFFLNRLRVSHRHLAVFPKYFSKNREILPRNHSEVVRFANLH